VFKQAQLGVDQRPVASRAFPGRALKLIGADDPWNALQTSFYFNF